MSNWLDIKLLRTVNLTKISHWNYFINSQPWEMCFKTKLLKTFEINVAGFDTASNLLINYADNLTTGCMNQ